MHVVTGSKCLKGGSNRGAINIQNEPCWLGGTLPALALTRTTSETWSISMWPSHVTLAAEQRKTEHSAYNQEPGKASQAFISTPLKHGVCTQMH